MERKPKLFRMRSRRKDGTGITTMLKTSTATATPTATGATTRNKSDLVTGTSWTLGVDLVCYGCSIGPSCLLLMRDFVPRIPLGKFALTVLGDFWVPPHETSDESGEFSEMAVKIHDSRIRRYLAIFRRRCPASFTSPLGIMRRKMFLRKRDRARVRHSLSVLPLPLLSLAVNLLKASTRFHGSDNAILSC